MDKAKFEHFNLGELKAAQDILWVIASSDDCSKTMQKQAEQISKLLGETIEHIRVKHRKSFLDLQQTIDQLRKIGRKF